MNSQKGVINLVPALLFGALIVGGFAVIYNTTNIFKQSSTPAPSASSLPSISPSQSPTQTTDDWILYMNDNYGFELSLPPGSQEQNEGYLRIQNYQTEDLQDGYRLQPGHYFLELIAYGDQSCRNELVTAESVNINGVEGFKGQALGGGDSAKYRTSACLNKSGTWFIITVSEDESIVGDKILNSLKFVN